MNIYTRLNVISGLDNITKSNINYSIKQHITRLWIEDGMPILDYEFSLKDNVIFWAKSWFNTLSLNMKEWLLHRIECLENNKVDSEGINSFPKFLCYQLGDGYIFRYIDSLQFDSDFSKKDEIVKYIIQVLSELSINADLYFGDISYHEIVCVISDILLHRTFLDYIKDSADNAGKLLHVNEGKPVHTEPTEDLPVSVYFERVGDTSLTHDKYTSLLASVVTDIISPLGRNKNLVKEYDFVFKALNKSFSFKDELNVFNRISNNVIGIDLRIDPIEFNFSTGIEQDLVTYFIDVMIRYSILSQEETFKDPRKVEEMFGCFRSEFLKKVFFDRVINSKESDIHINEPLKEINVRGYYGRYNLEFDNAPQYYNYSLYTMAFVYTDSRYITENVEDFTNRNIIKHFDEYIRWYIYINWLKNLEQIRGVYDVDIYQLIPNNLDTLDEVLPLIRKLVERNVFETSRKYNSNQIEEAYSATAKPFQALERLEHYNYVLSILDVRLEGAKYYWFDKSRLIETLPDGSTIVKYNYRYRFYKHVMKFIEEFDNDKLIEFIKEFNDFYSSFNSLITYSPYADPAITEVTLNITPNVKELKVGYTQVLNIETNGDYLSIESENPEYLIFNAEDNSIKAIDIGEATLTIRASYGTKLTKVFKIKINIIENTDERDSWIERFENVDDYIHYREFLYFFIKDFSKQNVDDMIKILDWVEDLKINNYLKPTSIILSDFILNDVDIFYDTENGSIIDPNISQVQIHEDLNNHLLDSVINIVNPFLSENYPYILRYIDFIQDNNIIELSKGVQAKGDDTLNRTIRFNYIRIKIYSISKLNPELVEYINSISKDEITEIIDRHEMKVVREYILNNNPSLYNYLEFYYWYLEYKKTNYSIDIDDLITTVNRKMRSYYENKDTVSLNNIERELVTDDIKRDMNFYKEFKNTINGIHIYKNDNKWLNKVLFELDNLVNSKYRIGYYLYIDLLKLSNKFSENDNILYTKDFSDDIRDMNILNLESHLERKNELIAKYPLMDDKFYKNKLRKLLDIVKMDSVDKWKYYCENIFKNNQYTKFLNIETVIEIIITSGDIVNIKHLEFHDDKSRTWRVKYCEPNNDIYNEFNKVYRFVATPHQGTSFTSISDIPENYMLQADELICYIISNSVTSSSTNGFKRLFVRSDSGTFLSHNKKITNGNIFLTLMFPNINIVSMTLTSDNFVQSLNIKKYIQKNDETNIIEIEENNIPVNSNRNISFIEE